MRDLKKNKTNCIRKVSFENDSDKYDTPLKLSLE